MNAFTKLVLCAALIAAPSVGFTQQTGTETEVTETSDDTTAQGLPDAPQTETAGDGELEATPPAEQVVAVHGDWQIRCRTEEQNCFMYQLAIDARDIPISEVSVVTLNSDDGRVAGFTIVTPLRTLLTEGVTLQIDNGQQQRYQFGWCAEPGCYARFAVREDGLNQFKRGNKARVTVRSVERPDAPVILDVSLSGFTAAFDDLASR